MPTFLNFVWGRFQYACVAKCIFEYTNMHQMCQRHLFWLPIVTLAYRLSLCIYLLTAFWCTSACVCVCGVRIFTVHLMITCFLFCLQEYTGPGGAEVEIEKPAKDEYAIAKWIKKNVPTKKTKFLNHHVEYFTGIIFNISLFIFHFDMISYLLCYL